MTDFCHVFLDFCLETVHLLHRIELRLALLNFALRLVLLGFTRHFLTELAHARLSFPEVIQSVHFFASGIVHPCKKSSPAATCYRSNFIESAFHTTESMMLIGLMRRCVHMADKFHFRIAEQAESRAEEADAKHHDRLPSEEMAV
eukprot:CAMPEP_0197636806 /NCGR_PEP_ID=MMETSP1338-20131121/12208_1 /TAXON_ID=43686 ORGANISM="Pelagodinium beii, Strain RCC1491" /NCGR_SAMPLE_ID=MMETSP1338 /ASSEMBLY_ACC=CAM_ASM_000754 /LENGTH=144 /DNA_ID=CAMNT_0043209111 /DNA_START=196 /DNA_END=630 /DNA_ORIENTATION=+